VALLLLARRASPADGPSADVTAADVTATAAP
jgi:hypothetical protein